MSLEDFLPKDYIETLPHSVSSIWWGGGHHLSASGTQLVLRVVVPSLASRGGPGDEEAEHVELSFDLETGRAIPPDETAWSKVLSKVTQVRAADRASQAAYDAAAPLVGPRSDEESDWHQYLREAFFRIDPRWEKDFPATKVIRLPAQKDYQASVGWLEEALHRTQLGGAIMIASPSQDNLVHVLSEIAATVPRGSLKEMRIYVAVDGAHTAAVAKALAATAARYIQLDPDRPIPQRKARLERSRSPNP
jgi:hypothetical protein